MIMLGFHAPNADRWNVDMASKKSMEKVVRALYAARKRGDFDAMAELCTPACRLHVAGAPEFCHAAGTTTGRAALRKRFAELRAFDFANHKMLSIMADGNRVAVHWRTKVTFKPTGKSAVSEFCDLWTIRNGKIASAVQFIDTALVAHLVE
jgi:ketosteroid isomerase-like protein